MKLFNHNDAHRQLTNLTSEMAQKWVRIANRTYQDMVKMKARESQAIDKAIRVANYEMQR